MLTYLATPYSHPDPKVRKLRFLSVNSWAAKLMAAGEHIYSPISHCHPIALAGELPKDWRFWASHCRTMMMCCSKIKVLQLPGWQHSVGVDAEIRIAKEFGMPIEYILP